MLDRPAVSAVPVAAPEALVPWGLGEAALALVIFLVANVLGGGLLLVVARHLYNTQPLMFGIIFYQFIFLGMLVSVAVLIIGRHGVGLDTLGFRFPGWRGLLTTPLAGLIAVVIGVAILYTIFNALFPSFNLHGNTKDLFKGTPNHLGAGKEILVLLWAAVEAPFTEEILFRGIIFQGLRSFFRPWLTYVQSVVSAAIVSGLVFGAVHFEIHTLPILAFTGVVLALTFQSARSIYSSMIVHAVINGFAILQVFGPP